MSQINMKIDRDRFLKDVLDMGNFIINDNKSYNRYHFLDFLSLNEFASEMYDIYIDEDEIFNFKPNLVDKLRRSQDMEFDKFCSFISKNGKFLYEVFKNTHDFFEKINFVPFCCDDCLKKFNQQEANDIIIDFYSQYGDKYYKIIKKYFDENRIEFGYDLGPATAAVFMPVIPMKSGYIFTDDRKLDSKFISYLVHEFGHVIDAETFIFPQQKIIGIWEDALLEIPSTCFENLFIQQLSDKKIDYTGGLLLNNAIYYDLNQSSKILTEVLKDDNLTIDEYGFAIYSYEDEEGNEVEIDIPLRESLIYSIGNLFALYFKELDKKDRRNFLKAFNDIITSRKEESLENLISRLDVTPSDFASLKYIKSNIEENNMKLKKRFNYYS